MRYPRHAKIFRGGVDAAPFAGLFFVVVLFVLLFGSHVFIPGVRVALGDEPEPPEVTSRTVRVLKSGSVVFLGEEYDSEGLKTHLADLVQQDNLPERLIFEAEPGANEQQVKTTENLIQGLGISIKYPGSRMELPAEGGFSGSPLRTVVVGLNLNGQIFFQHQLVSDLVLEQRLRAAVTNAPHPLAMVLQADRKVPFEKIVALSNIARRAGVAEMVFATRPASGP